MRTRLLIIVLVVAAALLGGTATVANSADNGDPDNDREDDRKTMTLYGAEASFTYITATGEVNPPEQDVLPMVGDRLIIVDELFSDEARTEEVGTNDIECTFTHVEGTEETFEGVLLCHGIVHLDDHGDISWQARALPSSEPTPEEPIAHVALTGGTGDFNNAGGEAMIFEDPSDTQSQTRYEITLLLLDEDD